MSDRKPDFINPNSPEFLLSETDKIRLILENRGGWYSVSGSLKAAHYFIKGNPGSDLAISLCVDQIHPVDRLHAPTEGQKCLVCSLMVDAGKVGDFQGNLERRRVNALKAQALAERLKAAQEERKSKSKHHKE